MSFALSRLSPEEKKALRQRLWQRQNGVCFITQRPIDLLRDEVEIDHIVPTRDKGPDDESNWAIVFARANESKQAAHLYVARVLYRLEQIREKVNDPRGANLGHVLADYGGARFPLKLAIAAAEIRFKLTEKLIFDEISAPIWRDELSGMRSVFVRLPIEFLHHDDKINPRPIGNSIRGLVEEFHRKRPQLHIPLAWINTRENGDSKVRLFDGQHKAAAQILLDQTWLRVRIFVDPDTDVLITTNTNAGTNLRQVAFDKSTQRFLGASILADRIERFLKDKGRDAGDEQFSERDLVDHFRGEQGLGKVIEHYFINIGRIVHKERLFQYKFPEQLSVNISNFLDNLGRVPVWVDHQLSLTAFGGKASAGFWEHIFETGNDPSGAPVIHFGGLNLLDMIRAA